eukprot:CAMPEP_0116126020 /NCGR_PEP_ID=MMETSP0329-20121206/6115_1 /TAXON_ID=697910 /ORGANISM="Pseudo-nitzschia arenysensis, Strain B593" /LENGTH=314 /DNA_ID=CAMNT_0003620087 /DNA_START=47 /DNA_END=991 /DNA_ORIENTATION=+
MAADEETALVPNSNEGESETKVSKLGKLSTIELNLETIRFWGLVAVIALLATGKFFTTYAVVFPPKDNPSSFYDKLFNGAPSDFEPTETFIYKLFKFNHTCSQLDFNPSRTISAIVVMFHTIPINFFIVCHYFRITSHKNLAKFGDDQKSMERLQLFTKIATPIELVVFTYFYLVFVNSPNGEYGTEEGMNKFAAHYVPYMLWKVGLLLMAIQQCWYMYLKDDIPPPFDKIITRGMLWGYVLFVFVMLIVYIVFVWSFINGTPVWDTTQGTLGYYLAIALMFSWVIISIILPALFAYLRSKDGNDFFIVLQELQ